MSEIVRGKDKKERRVPLRGKVRGAENAGCDSRSLLKLKQQEYSLEKSLASLMENAKPEALRAVLHDMGDIARNR